jgi:lysyl-tRNA synthetase class 2
VKYPVHVHELNVLSNSKTITSCKTDAEGKHTCLADPEQRYRRRYVDLTVNDHVKATFIERTKLFNAMRSFFNDKRIP